MNEQSNTIWLREKKDKTQHDANNTPLIRKGHNRDLIRAGISKWKAAVIHEGANRKWCWWAESQLGVTFSVGELHSLTDWADSEESDEAELEGSYIQQTGGAEDTPTETDTPTPTDIHTAEEGKKSAGI